MNEVIKKMYENSINWHKATEEEKVILEKENQILGQSIGAEYDPEGVWKTKTGEKLYNVLDNNESDTVYSVELNPEPVKTNEYNQPISGGSLADTENEQGSAIGLDTKISDYVAENNKSAIEKMQDTIEDLKAKLENANTGDYDPENETDYTGTFMLIGGGLIAVGILKAIFNK